MQSYTLEDLKAEIRGIKALPPIPYFNPRDEDRGCALVKAGIPNGSHWVLLAELLQVTLHGESWAAGRTPNDPRRTVETVATLLNTANLDPDDATSLLAILGAEEMNISGDQLTWWRAHRPHILAGFSRCGFSAADASISYLSGCIAGESWDFIQGLILLGLARERVAEARSAFEQNAGFKPQAQWNPNVPPGW